MASTRVMALASIIATNIATIDKHLAAEGLPSPSFDADIPPGLLLDIKISSARQAVLEATDELHALMLGPAGLLTSTQHNSLISLQAIYRFNLAAKIPLENDGTPFKEIANCSGLEESSVRRILRHAMAYHIFQEPRKGFVTHTAASYMLAESAPIREWIGLTTEEMWSAATKTVDALAMWPDSQEPNHSGFNLAHNTDATVFEELAKSPMRFKRYAEAMSWFTTGAGFDITHLLDNYAWDTVGTVVDVGGSKGSVSVALAQRFPALRCIVQDRPEVIAEGLARLLPDLYNRVTFMHHDFFSAQPVRDADVFLLRQVLHDWSDKYALQILRSLIPALKSGTRIVVNEHVLPDPGKLSAYQEKLCRTFDLAMMEFHNAKERDADDWARLFQDADSRFNFLGIQRPASSRLGIIVARWE